MSQATPARRVKLPAQLQAGEQLGGTEKGCSVLCYEFSFPRKRHIHNAQFHLIKWYGLRRVLSARPRSLPVCIGRWECFSHA